jgi:hypothetical protein
MDIGAEYGGELTLHALTPELIILPGVDVCQIGQTGVSFSVGWPGGGVLDQSDRTDG